MIKINEPFVYILPIRIIPFTPTWQYSSELTLLITTTISTTKVVNVIPNYIIKINNSNVSKTWDVEWLLKFEPATPCIIFERFKSILWVYQISGLECIKELVVYSYRRKRNNFWIITRIQPNQPKIVPLLYLIPLL